MKAVLMGLLMMMAAQAAVAEEFVAGQKEGETLQVDVFPQENDAVSIDRVAGGATLTIESFTSWCGQVTLTAQAKSLLAAHELHRKLIAEKSGIPGQVKTIQKLILSVENGVLNCRVDSAQSFLFLSNGAELKGDGPAHTTARATGAQCEALIKNF